jgi:acyl-coenzyme A synthetase/AMP-(fatty) acid ligase
MQQQEMWQAQWYREGFFRDETLADLIRATARTHPDSYVALESDVRPGRMTLAEIWTESERAAGAMHRLGIGAGDVVAIQLPNWIEALVLCQAAQLLGAVMLPITAILGSAEVEYIVGDSGAKALFIPELWRGRDYREMIPALAAAPAMKRIVVIGDEAPAPALNWRDFLAGGDTALPPCPARADDVALLIYTSGTTSRPKGVLHTHNSLLCDARNNGLCWGEQVNATYLSPWPFGHIAGLLSFTHVWMHGCNVVCADRWEPEHVARLVEKHRVGATSGVPWFLQSLMDAADATGADISSLKNYGTGATNVDPRLVQRCNERGILCYRQYGSTEHPTVTSGLPEDPLEKRIRTEGRCFPGNRVRILDDDGNDVPAGVDGEIATAGPERFIGYKDAARNADAFTADGWFLTGDIGNLDAEGYLTITDRKKDIIIRGGENISSREVEECLQHHPAVVEAAAVAMADARLGEKVCVFVALRPGHSLALTTVVEHFAQRGMAKQKTPERIVEIEALPRNATGKVLKEVLRQRLKQEG